ncbi:MAG TPA: M28 family peptidase, partial [Longimicrobiales bacterium]|nr:M28 family peptidase [Longimicrobiales bacterium]
AQFQLFVRSRGTQRYFVAGELNEPIWQSSLPSVLGGPRLTRALIPGIASLVGRLTGKTGVTPVALEKDIAVSIRATVEVIASQNVIGIIPGRDRALANEFVMFTAHYDHLGISTPDPRGDSIYNGFSDNAAGVAMVLAIAQALVHSPPARSTAFLFVSAEERGLLGSSYYAAQPVLPLAQTVAVINLDAGAPPAPPIEWRLAGGANSTLGALSEQIAQRHGWKIDLGLASPNSDYWPFHTRGVPAVFLIPGPAWEGLSPRERDALRARWDRYHRADDEWADAFPFSGLRRYAQLALEIGTAAANAPKRPALITH